MHPFQYAVSLLSLLSTALGVQIGICNLDEEVEYSLNYDEGKCVEVDSLGTGSGSQMFVGVVGNETAVKWLYWEGSKSCEDGPSQEVDLICNCTDVSGSVNENTTILFSLVCGGAAGGPDTALATWVAAATMILNMLY
eukprot:TRINITY_DN4031_c0_g1_i1.p1 TRINITY_DN4031_c0_g1~~TRINITY_DN4031_c0_g1_i1.p1  ORF type:complete len:138 (+),score=25.04 TRINITY_DN4031_c0_g1_i1:123-536(+)